MRSALLVPAAVVALSLAGAPAASAKCHSGVHKFGSVQARTFCGHASARVTVGGKTHKIDPGGMCQVTSQYFTINVGTIVLGQTNRKPPDYFGITAGKTPLGGSPIGKDGTYTKDVTISFVYAGKRYGVIKPSLTLTAKRSKGAFSGTLISGGPVSGGFSCH